MYFSPYLVLVPAFGFFATAGCNFLILSLNLRHDLVHVQATGVVHLHHHRGLLQTILQLTQLLFFFFFL